MANLTAGPFYLYSTLLKNNTNISRQTTQHVNINNSQSRHRTASVNKYNQTKVVSAKKRDGESPGYLKVEGRMRSMCARTAWRVCGWGWGHMSMVGRTYGTRARLSLYVAVAEELVSFLLVS